MKQKIPYNGGVDYDSQVETNILDTMEGQTLSMCRFPAWARKRTLRGLDLTGKVALVARGSINFDVKAANAAAVGAVAIIIYNNTDEGLFYASLQSHSIPVITIAKQDVQAMLDAPEKEDHLLL